MSGEVVSLLGAAVEGNLEPQPEIIERLQVMMDMALSGKLTGLLYATVENDRSLGSGWVGNADQHQMIAAVTILKHRVLTVWEE